MPIPNHRPRLLVFVCAGALCLAGAVAGAQRRPIQLVQATLVGRTMFEPGDTARGGVGQPVDGIEGSSREMLAVHVHAHLALFYKGEQIAIPYGIGVVKPFQVDRGFVGTGSGIYWLHTHDATGIIHVESPDNRPYTLGNFFDIWGQPLTSDRVATLTGRVRAYVDGKVHAGNPRDIALGPHVEITLEVGTPIVTPPVYIFPDGL
jgi:hypothetical protein